MKRTIKETTDKVCSCGGKIHIAYVSGGLADWCDGCEREEKHKRLTNAEFAMPMGKHQGKKITELPRDYLVWGARELPRSLAKRFKEQLKKDLNLKIDQDMFGG